MEPKALSEHPEIAERIGHLIAAFSNLEYRMFIAFAAIATLHFANPSSQHIDECFAAFYERRSANYKSKLALDLAEPRLDRWRYLAWQRLWRRFKGASSRRTEVAHCVFMGSKSQGLMRLKVTTGEPRFEPLDVRFFDHTNLQFRTLGQDILTFLTFVLMTEDRTESLLRALPLPINIAFPQKPEALPAPQDPRAKDEQVASIYRLGLAPLYEED